MEAWSQNAAADILNSLAVMHNPDTKRGLVAMYLRMARLQGERDGIESVAQVLKRQA